MKKNHLRSFFKRYTRPIMFSTALIGSVVGNMSGLANNSYAATNNHQTPSAPQQEIIRSHAISAKGIIKYPANFSHWEYVNPNAPKGGTLTLGTQGTYDNFNAFAQRGSRPDGVSSMYDSLMVDNLDEIEVMYGLIAKEIEYPKSYEWVRFYLDPKARFSDDTPITARDVVFSFNKFYEQGLPQFKTRFLGVTVKALDDHTVEFSLPEPNQSRIMGLAALTIFPEHVYKNIDLREPFKEPQVSSGPFTVSDYKMGQYIVYARNKNYWAKDHPTQKGLNNFDFYRYEYYLDETVLFEAFKKGEYDVRQENISKNWATQYTGDIFESKKIIKEQIPHQIPTANQAYIFNITRPQFQDRRVREALSYLFDFEWTNKHLFFGAYTRNKSNFINTQYAADGIPTGRELEILKGLDGHLPKALFKQPFQPPVTDGSGNIRNQIRKALSLFKQAGYTLKDGKLLDPSGKQLAFEALFYSASSERVAIPFKENLKKVGIKLNIRLLSDVSQYINRLRNRDYDMIVSHLGGYPSVMSLKREWHSDFFDSTYNSVGVQDKNIDFLIDQIEKSQGNEDEVIAYSKALDRYILWQHYCIPQWHFSFHRVAYWNKFSKPLVIPKYGLGLSSWWLDTHKEAALNAIK